MDAIERLRFYVESAGAQYLGIDAQSKSILFRDVKTGKVLSLYTTSVRSVADIAMALKRCHEEAREEGWQSGI